MSARDLMDRLAGHRIFDEAAVRSFAHELLLAQDAGHLSFQVEHNLTFTPSPDREPDYFLQSVRKIALTIGGRDRARGRMIIEEHSDASRDDGRLISRLVLAEIAAAIEEQYAPEQLAVFFSESGVPLDELTRLTPGLSTAAALLVFNALLAWGSEGRRTLRHFIGSWLSDDLLSGPTELQRRSIVSSLNRQGWHVHDGELVIGDRITKNQPSPMAVEEGLHPWVWTAARSLWQSKHYRQGVLDAAASINNNLQMKLGRYDVADDKLIQEAFREAPPEEGKARLRVVGATMNPTGASRQRGLMHFGLGCFFAIRNPAAHERDTLAAADALEYLTALSVFARMADNCEVDRLIG